MSHALFEMCPKPDIDTVVGGVDLSGNFNLSGKRAARWGALKPLSTLMVFIFSFFICRVTVR